MVTPIARFGVLLSSASHAAGDLVTSAFYTRTAAASYAATVLASQPGLDAAVMIWSEHRGLWLHPEAGQTAVEVAREW